MEVTNLIHTEQVIGKNRSFFIDLKKTVKGNNYLTITQSRKKENDEKEFTKIFLFEQDIARFSEAMMRSLLKFTLVKDKETEAYKAAVREEYPNAYTKWSDADEAELKTLFSKGQDIDKLCKKFQRNAAGIQYRLIKLGLMEPEEVKTK